MNKAYLPSLIFGTSCLGNLYHIMDEKTKQELVDECLAKGHRPVVFDSAGKYGAGLALESLGQCLKNARIAPDEVVISNKLGWLRTALITPEPLFEPGVWKGLTHDAVQAISYDGIMDCYHQGNELLGDYTARMVSVHDPDEYLSAASDDSDERRRYDDILDAYRALFDLKRKGQVSSVGIGAKNWQTIKHISQDVALDWVMIANSMTVHSHPQDLLIFMQELEAKGIPIINSAVFNGGFLTGSDFYNYTLMTPEANMELYTWREKFYKQCQNFSIAPAVASVAFARKIPGVEAIAMSTTKPKNVSTNIDMTNAVLPITFWQALISEGLINPNLKQFLIN